MAGGLSPAKDIQGILPHRPPFLFVDEILSVDLEARSIETARSVPLSEPWTHAHFPTKPIVPGVLILEGMLQSCGILGRHLSPGDGPPVVGLLGAIDSARFRRIAYPGDRIRYQARLLVRVGNLLKFTATALIDGAIAATANVSVYITSP